MKKEFFLNCFTGLLCIISSPHWARGNEGKPGHYLKCSYTVPATLVSDTLPAPEKNTGNTGDKPAGDIKEVPKSRNQPIPVPVALQVKPIKIIKPKIIKPVIKVLH